MTVMGVILQPDIHGLKYEMNVSGFLKMELE